VKTSSKPPNIIRKTKEARAKLKIGGREGWMLFNPTMGTYQRRKIRKKRMTQVKTSNPIKILFCGLFSNVILLKFKYEAHRPKAGASRKGNVVLIVPLYPAHLPTGRQVGVTRHLPAKIRSSDEPVGAPMDNMYFNKFVVC